MDVTIDQVWAIRDLVDELKARGVELKGEGNELQAKCPFHQDSKPSFSVNVAKKAWTCRAGCGGGSVVDLIAKFEGRPSKAVFKDLANEVRRKAGWTADSAETPTRAKTAEPTTDALAGPPEAKSTVVAEYDYHDQNGEFAYQVVRLQPKSFRQRHKKAGAWVWNMDGVTRYLFRLPQVIEAREVFICEGEKDVVNLVKAGFCATCNVGGAGKWLESYTEHLREKDVILCGDNDIPGKDHMNLVAKSLEGKVASLRRVAVPDPHKDVSDYLGTLPEEKWHQAVADLRDATKPMIRGVDIPLYSMAELEADYMVMVEESAKNPVDLGLWLPSMRNYIRPLVPGDLVSILAPTATGKTAVLQNIASALRQLPTVLFELEISGEIMFERILAERGGFTGAEVEQAYRAKKGFGAEAMQNAFPNLLVCTKPSLTVDQIDTWAKSAELKLGVPPKLILVDYIQLMRDTESSSRYERFSNIAEGLRTVAKNRRAVVIFSSQVQRKKADDSPEVTLSDAKESGSIENASSLVLGVWREFEEETGEHSKMNIRVLKQTRGKSGLLIECNWKSSMKITERPRVDS